MNPQTIFNGIWYNFTWSSLRFEENNLLNSEVTTLLGPGVCHCLSDQYLLEQVFVCVKRHLRCIKFVQMVHMFHFPVSCNNRKSSVKTVASHNVLWWDDIRLIYCSTDRGGNLPGSSNSFSGKCVVEKADCSQWSVANRQPWQRLIGPHGLNSQSKAQDEELSTNERGHRAQPAENGDMSPSLPSPSPHSAPLLVDLQRQASMLWSRACFLMSSNSAISCNHFLTFSLGWKNSKEIL